ncbi:MAG: FecR domain-containing protein [Archangium sp.]|nr:FecR domain-containing protein [Archangium sp.]
MTSACANRDRYLARALPPADMTAFEAHAEGCDECRAEVQRWSAFGAALTAQLEPSRRPPTRAQVAALLERAEAPPPRRSWAFAGVAVVTAAAALVFVLRPAPEVPWVPAVVASREAAVDGGRYVTAPAGHALLRIGDDDVGVGPSTQLEVERAGSRATVVRLLTGAVAAQVNAARGPRQFDVETPLGRVHVVGTVFRVRVVEGRLDVDVLRGTVEVTATSGARARLTAGQTQRFGAEASPAAPLDATAFEELEASPPSPPPPAPAIDAKAPAPSEKPQPARASAPVTAWRSAAARGGCDTVVIEARRWLTHDANDADVWLVLGDCLRRQGNAKASVDAYLAAGKTSEPQGKRGLLLAASLLQGELRQPARALTAIDAYLRAKPESRELEASALVRKALALSDLGRSAAAAAVLRDVVKRLPETSSAAEAVRLLERVGAAPLP